MIYNHLAVRTRGIFTCEALPEGSPQGMLTKRRALRKMSFQEINILNKDLPFFSRDQELNKGLALIDLDGTIRSTKSGKQFINNNFKDQKLITNIDKVLQTLNYLRYTIIGISNQG